MTGETYACGRCGARFHRGRKYCMNCGAMLSMPLHGRSRYSDEPTTSERVLHSGWIEAGILLFLIGAIVYIGMRNVWAREANKTVWVETGTRYQDINTGVVLRSNVERKLVPASEADKYKSKTILTDGPENLPDFEKNGKHRVIRDKPDEFEPRPTIQAAAPRGSVEVPIVIPIEISPEVKDHSRRVEKVSVIKTGMTRGQVRKIWGEPKKTEVYKSSAGVRISDRWYYGDPVLNLDLYSRYVEFDSSGIVVFVHDEYSKHIRMRPE